MQKDKGRKSPNKRSQKERPEFDQQIVDLARVTRVTEGGKQLNFRVCIVIGNRKGRVGFGIAKGKDVQIAVEKAVRQAQKNIIDVPLIKETIPHRVVAKFKAAKIMLKPAPKGSGILAGGAARTILELAGVPNASSKMLGKTSNKVTNVKATFAALQMFLPRAVAKTKRVAIKPVSPEEIVVAIPVIEEKTVVPKKPAAKKKSPSVTAEATS